ncbi:dihydroxyacetone kinase [Leifsonia sp. Root4]|uniref:dihydroxyacetone kinase family protein n=1 Tax=Leifsonia sp. Root4 TaxID=1736525 RepID=UPI0006FB0A73|nr:dihydroxyacetone kinase family protein [Leifsonia sp. Root4]KQW08283.1 dihydroxyacetone kinase [Leifsonia sp. Root4]
MSHLITDAATFAADAIDGFVAANKRYARRVDGGVVRSTVMPEGQVALVVGGGSGHYPAFAGVVGPGLAAGAVCGNIFASPATGQVYRVAKAVERGAGILLSYGNYAGDRLQFGQAEERLRGEGYDVRTVAVTDDIASAPAAERERRRGIAGDLTVFKVAGAAAEAGMNLDEVERLAILANDRTRSIGVAFSGCTIPGAESPLFTVEPGTMAIGLGIHGEPGLEDVPAPTARGLAEILASRLLAELPDGVEQAAGSRAVVLLNGLGTFKYEELFTVFGAVSAELEAAGVDILDSECGELVTSLDMSGVSLTLLWVTDELAELWAAPADSAAFRKGAITAMIDENISSVADATATRVLESATPAQQAAATAALRLLRVTHDTIIDNAEEFGRIDAIAGDGDHGIGMSRGVVGALAAGERVVSEGGGVVRLLAESGEAWSEHGGGTSGALWGMALASAGTSLAASGAADENSDDTIAAASGAAAIAAAVAAGLVGMQRLGKAEVGDKTLIDAYAPFAAKLTSGVAAGNTLADAWVAAAAVSQAAASATAELKPGLGRARTHVARSLGHPDAGAISFARIVMAVGDALQAH